jgi:hypothetical protein
MRGLHVCGLQFEVGAAPAVEMKKLARITGAE